MDKPAEIPAANTPAKPAPKPLLVIFDGNALVHRAYHAMPPLTIKKTGEMVGAVYGFVQILLKTIGDLKPTHYAIAFDKKGPTFRHRMYDQYKAQRPHMTDELAAQLGRVRQIVEAFHMPVYELDEYEADDVLGTLSRQASQLEVDTIIVTGDNDAMQLVGPRVRVLTPKHTFNETVLYDEAAVMEKFGVLPGQIADYKGLVGDTSDNIPGVPGVGEKTAARLLHLFGSLEEIYSRLDEVPPPRVQNILRLNQAVARQSKELATIVTHAPVQLDLDDCHLANYDRNKVSELFRELEFYSLVNRLPQALECPEVSLMPAPPRARENKYHIVDTMPALEDLARRLGAAETFAFDTETTSIDAMAAKLVGLSFAISPGEAWYIPVGHVKADPGAQLPWPDVREVLRPVLENESLPKIAHNGKYDMTVLGEAGVNVAHLASDTMVAAHLLGETLLNLKALAFNRLGLEMAPISDLIGTGSKALPMSEVEIPKVADYCGADADMTLRLAGLLGGELVKENLNGLYEQLEMPLVPVLMEMERTGVALDRRLLGEISRTLGEQLMKLMADIFNSVGHQFNLNSPQQLSHVLFEELKLGAGKKTQTGFSTGAGVLEELRGEHEAIALILEYRQYTKLKSTYIDVLPALVNERTGRLHTSFNQTRTTTGRLSSSDPNLQNIPVRTEMGRQIRRAFIAPPGYVLLAGDYSQIDLRALAHLSQDPALLDAFYHDEDIHRATAAQLYEVPADKVTPEMRRLAKVVNFGVIYGMSGFGLEQATELSRAEAERFIKAYFERYPGVTAYLEATKQQARERGYVQTILGRRRYITGINAPNRQVREAAERMAINMPVQGTSADIIKVAMINLSREMARRELQSKMILQVHDELIFEVPEAELGMMKTLVSRTMSGAVELKVPLKVDMKSGPNWGEME